jgi:hypothetical protein
MAFFTPLQNPAVSATITFINPPTPVLRSRGHTGLQAKG